MQAPQFGRGLAAESQQLAHQAIGIARRFQGLLQGFVAGVLGVRQVFDRQPDPAGDRGQRVVEIVGDAPGEAPQRLGFLALHQLHLQRFLAFVGAALHLGVVPHAQQQSVDPIRQLGQFVIPLHTHQPRGAGPVLGDALQVGVQALQALQHQVVQQQHQQCAGQQARHGGQTHATPGQCIALLLQPPVQPQHQFGHRAAEVVAQHGVQLVERVIHRLDVHVLPVMTGVGERQARRHHQHLGKARQLALFETAHHGDGPLRFLAFQSRQVHRGHHHQIQLVI
ncbi:MAG: hypothetical protein A3B67_06085 [Burkholderiales bacterium RIFCSPHIGHO2_02_FULL_66_10]|nr:MAG: hypothetical protein A3B67_06085 [Burkholderiales bacterium RIFCSPHIGHO2_02_FULL_66_10]